MNSSKEENVPWPLPKSWQWTTVEQIAQTSSGGTPRRDRPEYYGGQIPWIKSGELRDRVVFESEESITEQGLTSSSAKLFPKGTVCIALYGATVGRLGILGLDATTNQAVCGIFLPACLNQRFLFWYLQLIRPKLIEMGKGGAQPNISQAIVRTTLIPVAPTPEQQRITEEIEKQFTRLDAAVAALKRVQANLKRYRAAVLKAACEGRLVPTEAELARREGRSYEPASELLKCILAEHRSRWETTQRQRLQISKGLSANEKWKSKYQELSTAEISAFPDLPEGWVWSTTEQVGHVQLGRQRSPKNHTGTHMRPYLRVANVFEDRIDTSDILSMNFSPSEFVTFELKFGDILLNEGQSLEWVGRPAMYRGEVPGACFQNTLIRFTPYDGLEAKYALLVFRAYLHNRRFQKAARWTVNIAHLGADRLSKIEFPLPPRAEQLRIVAELERRLSIVEEIETEVRTDLSRAERLRQSILKRAFEGKLVPQDTNDEPASVLLERIRAERAQNLEKAVSAKAKRPPRKREFANAQKGV